jgi:hypothetical protein
MKVFVYFNLHKKVWSVKALSGKNKGRVIAHCETLVLKNCQLKVSQAGRKRVLQEKRKNVHAGVVGEVVALHKGFKPTKHLITYNPYKYDSFVDKATEQPVYTAPRAYMKAQAGHGAKVYITKK